MLHPINTLFNRSHAKITRLPVEAEPLQPITSTNSGSSPSPRPQLSITTSLPNTADRVQQIQTSLANNTRAEFANVIEQLNASQGKQK
jgi:hypothetical protein